MLVFISGHNTHLDWLVCRLTCTCIPQNIWTGKNVILSDPIAMARWTQQYYWLIHHSKFDCLKANALDGSAEQFWLVAGESWTETFL